MARLLKNTRAQSIGLILSIILLHNPIFAKSQASTIFKQVNDSPILTINLQKLTSQDNQINQILLEMDQKPPLAPDQIHFIRSYLYALLGNFEQALKESQAISEHSKLYSLSRYFYYDFILNQQTDISAQDIQTWIEDLESLAPTVALVLNSSFEALLYKLYLQKFSRLEPKKTSSLQTEQFLSLLSKHPDRYTEQKVQATQAYIKVLERRPEKERDFFFRKLLEMFPQTPLMKSLIPKQHLTDLPTKDFLEPDEATVEAKYQTAQTLLKQGKTNLALNTWIHILNHFPQTQTFQQTTLALRQMIKQHVDKEQDLTPYTNQLTHLPPDQMYTEARYLWNREENKIAMQMLQTFIQKYPFHDNASNAHFIMASIYEQWGEFEKAIAFYQKMVDRYSLSRFQTRSLFKVGFLSYLTDQLDQAQEYLLLELEQSSSMLRSAQAHYWLYKVYQKQKKSASASKHKDQLLKQYPITMYALLLNQKPKLPKQTKKEPYKTNQQTYITELVSLYLSVGLHDLVYEVLSLVIEKSDLEKYQMAKKLEAIHRYTFSMNLAFDVMGNQSQNQNLDIHTLRLFFPIDPYHAFFTPKAHSHVNELLAYSVMKQESAFNTHAISSAQAMGLLQLLMPTAQQMARKNKLTINRWDLFTPSINITLGTTYLRDQLNQFDDNLIDTLIAYNAGPSRAKKWRGRWAHLEPDAYIEMIPFQETRSYVKLILRNMYYYQAHYPDVFQKTIDFKGLPEGFVK